MIKLDQATVFYTTLVLTITTTTLELHKSIIEVHDFTKIKKKSRIVNIRLKFCNKQQSDFNYVKKTGKELLAIK